MLLSNLLNYVIVCLKIINQNQTCMRIRLIIGIGTFYDFVIFMYYFKSSRNPSSCLTSNAHSKWTPFHYFHINNYTVFPKTNSIENVRAQSHTFKGSGNSSLEFSNVTSAIRSDVQLCVPASPYICREGPRACVHAITK